MELLLDFFRTVLADTALAKGDHLDPAAAVKFLKRRSHESIYACKMLSVAHDLGDSKGAAFLRNIAASAPDSAAVATDLSPELFSLKTFLDSPEIFQAAHDRLCLAKTSKFRLFAGKRAFKITDPTGAAQRFHAKLSDLKEPKRAVVRTFKDHSIVSFVFYHERPPRDPVVMGRKLDMHRLMHRPVNEDFICLNEETGQIETEIGSTGERTAIRRAFAETCMDDADFFEGPTSTDFLRLDVLLKPDFSMDRDLGILTRIVLRMDQAEEPWIEIKSKNVIETMHANQMRETFPGLGEIHQDPIEFSDGRPSGPSLAGARVVKASLSIAVRENPSRIQVDLEAPNLIAFPRSIHTAAVFNALRALGLLKS